jgi:hypothetical protein
VELRTERGVVVRDIEDPSGGTFDAAGDFDRFLGGDTSPSVQSYRLFQYVDIYGDTIFNRLQMNEVLADIELATTGNLNPSEERGLARLRTMAEMCRDSVHLYLWFIGD